MDNQYHTPLEEAAARGQLDCVQFLDRVVAEQMLHHRSRANKQKKEAEKVARKRIKKVERNQKKRDKEYQKRVKKQNGVIENGSKENIPNHRSDDKKDKNGQNMRRARSLEHFSQLPNSAQKGSGSLLSVRTSNTQGSVRQTFLGTKRRSASSSSMTTGSKTNSLTGRATSSSLTSLDSANIIFHHRPSGAYKSRRPSQDRYLVRSSDGRGNSFTSIENIKKFDSLSSYNSHASSQATSSRYSWGSSRSIDSDIDTDNGEDEEMQSTSISDPKMAPLMTFLASLNLEQFTPTMRKESIDMKALALCTDQDLKSAGIPLGPRRKILEAVERRKKVCAEPGPLIDTHI